MSREVSHLAQWYPVIFNDTICDALQHKKTAIYFEIYKLSNFVH